MTAPEIGSGRWYTWETRYGPRGVLDSVLRLLEQRLVSRSKARELLEYAVDGRFNRAGHAPSAPWASLDWGPGEAETQERP